MSDKYRNPAVKFLAALALVAAVGLSGCGSREDRAEGYYQKGMEFLAKDDLVKARVELRNAVQVKGDMIAAWRGLAEVEEKAKNVAGIVAALRRITELDPQDKSARLKLARLTFASGALDDALRLVNSVIQLDDKNTEALAMKAALLLRMKDANGAVQEAHKVLGLDPGNVEAMTVLAAEKLSKDDPRGALDILEDVPAAAKDNVAILFLKIRVYERLKDTKNIEAVLQRLIELRPSEASLKRELIKFYVATKRLDDAEREMRALAAANPNDTKVGLELVGFLLQTRGPVAARTELEQRIKAGGATFSYQLALADLEFALGNYAQSTELVEKLIGSATTPADTLAARTRLAEMQLARKNIPAAEGLVNDILKADSRNVNGLKLRAAIRIERGQLEDAIADLRTALNDQPRSPELLALLAVAFERSGQIDLADKQMADAMKASNFDPKYGLNYVAFLQRRGISNHAENVLNELASRWPRNTQVLSSLAQLKIAQHDWAAANEIAETIRKTDGQSKLANQISAAVLGAQQKFNESISVLQTVYDANPNSTQALYALVRAYSQAKQLDKAETLLETTLKANPDNADAHVLMGLTKLARNAPEQAIASFKTAIEKQPKSTAGYSALANYYLARKDYDAAMTVLQDGLREQPTATNLRLSVAGIFEAKKDYEKAIAEYDALLKDDPGSMIVANNLASLLTDRRGDQASIDRAVTISAVLAKSQLPQFKDTLGWVYYRKGDYRRALPLLEEASTSLSNNPWVQYHLGMTYAAVGDQAKAAEQFAKASELGGNDSELKEKLAAAQKDK